jgi:hypothetical protein
MKKPTATTQGRMRFAVSVSGGSSVVAADMRLFS